MLSLSKLKVSIKSRRRPIVVGRGNGSGKGNFSGRGVKGQRSRTGGSNKLARLGMRHIIMQTPKLRGFASLRAKPAVVNLSDLEVNFKEGETVSPSRLKQKGLIKSFELPIKILGGGKLTKKLVISGCLISQAALKKLATSGTKISSSSKTVEATEK